MNKASHLVRWSRVICLGVLAECLPLRAAEGASSKEPPFVKKLERLELTRTIERDLNGSLIGVHVWAEYATDETFRQLARIPTLEWIRFSYISRSNSLTAAGISALTNAPNLKGVFFQCVRNAPDSLYDALGKLRQIETLSLISTWPTNHLAARSLTNLVSLKRLYVSGASHFTEEDFKTVASLNSLEEVKLLGFENLEEGAVGPLIASKTITNLEVWTSGFKLVRTRRP